MAHQPTKLETDIKRRVKALAGRAQKQRLEWMQLYPVGLEMDASVAVNKLAWSKLLASAKKWRTSADRDLRLWLRSNTNGRCCGETFKRSDASYRRRGGSLEPCRTGRTCGIGWSRRPRIER